MKKKFSKEYIDELIKRGESLERSEYHPLADGFSYSHISGPQYDQWISEIKILNERYLKSHPLYESIKSAFKKSKAYSELMGYLRALAEDDVFWEESEQRKDTTSMSFNKLPSNSEQLMNELLSAKNPSSYLCEKYKSASLQEKEVIRGIIKELEDEGYINVSWYDNIPAIVFLNNSARTYHERLAEYEKANIPTKTYAIVDNHQENALYDVFISHANKDKNDYVNELKKSIDKLKINVFYDKDTLEWGDKWKDKILEGVEKAEFAIIVISENFFDREWTEKELNEFLSRQNANGQKIILPILHNITTSQLKEKYPDVADIQVLSSSEHSCDEIALLFAGQLIKRLKS